jgi:hypothetical protein
MKTYTGTVVYSIFHDVTVEVSDDASRKDIELAIQKYFYDHDLKSKSKDIHASVFDVEEQS